VPRCGQVLLDAGRSFRFACVHQVVGETVTVVKMRLVRQLAQHRPRYHGFPVLAARLLNFLETATQVFSQGVDRTPTRRSFDVVPGSAFDSGEGKPTHVGPAAPQRSGDCCSGWSDISSSGSSSGIAANRSASALVSWAPASSPDIHFSSAVSSGLCYRSITGGNACSALRIRSLRLESHAQHSARGGGAMGRTWAAAEPGEILFVGALWVINQLVNLVDSMTF